MAQANITPLVAEQVTQTELRIVVREDGLRVIVDPALTTSRIFVNSHRSPPSRELT